MTRVIESAVMAMVLGAASFGAAGCGGQNAQTPTEVPSNAGSETEHKGSSGPAEVGKDAPDLAIQSMNGKGEIRLSRYSGKVVVVDFWATWCGPCRESFPALEALSRKFSDKLEVVGISVNDEPEGITEFAKELGTTFAVGWDKGQSTAERWKVPTMPTSFIVDADGKVRFIHAGFHAGDEKELEREVSSLLSEARGGSKAKSDASESSASAAGSSEGEGGESANSAPDSGDDAASERPSPIRHKTGPAKKRGGSGRGAKPKKSRRH